MDQGVHVEFHLVRIVVNFFKQRVKLVDRINAVGLARGLGAAAAANRRTQQGVRVGVAGGQIELEFRCHDWLQPFSGKQITHFAQHTARRKRHQIALMVKTVVDHLCGGVGGPRHDAHGGGVRAQLHVLVGGVNHIVVGAAFGKFTGDTHSHHRLRQTHATVFGELAARQNLATGNTRQIGHQALHLGDTTLIEPLLKVVEIH